MTIMPVYQRDKLKVLEIAIDNQTFIYLQPHERTLLLPDQSSIFRVPL